jgi:hypothetical protein
MIATTPLAPAPTGSAERVVTQRSLGSEADDAPAGRVVEQRSAVAAPMFHGDPGGRDVAVQILPAKTGDGEVSILKIPNATRTGRVHLAR